MKRPLRKYQDGAQKANEQSWLDWVGSYLPAVPEYYNQIVNYFEGEPDSFEEAFAMARQQGQPTFTWEGKLYNTEIKKEKPKVTKRPVEKPVRTPDEMTYRKSNPFTQEDKFRQAFMESRFKDSVVTGKERSPKGALGMTQGMPDAVAEFEKRNPGVKLDLTNPEDAVAFQDWMLQYLWERPYLNKPGQSERVSKAKVMGAYNWGQGNMKKFLEEQKAAGTDIYNSLGWVNKLPEEPRRYIQGILLNKLPEFQKELQRDTVDNKYNQYYGFEHGGQAVNPLAQLYMQQTGGAVVDPRGQWAHPGKHTIVPTPSGRITMQGVPYPVYGQDETGYGQMMYPGGEYTFPGQMVYEKPVMRDGGGKPEPRSFGMFSINPRNWGLDDYSEYPSFNHAFRAARNAKEKEFYFKGERYNTNLVPKEESDTYWDSKKFLKDFYQQHTQDNQMSDLERYKYEKQYLLDNLGFSDLKDVDVNSKEGRDKADRYMRAYSQMRKNPELVNQYAGKKIVEQRIKNLEQPSYFSITSQKPRDMSEDGYWNPKSNRLFVTTNNAEKDPGKLNTTYVHELAHKSNKGKYDYNVPEVNVELLNSSPYSRGINQEFYDYVSNPSEIEARKMSTLYYLNKQGLPFKPGKITEAELDRLYTDYSVDKLPYDVEQLLQLYGQQKGDLLKYLNGQRFQKGGQHGGLDRWFAEKWVDVKTGKPCGRQEGEDRSYPACRPSRRVSSQTPKTSSEMSPAEKAKFKRVKTSSQRIPYNHKRNS